MLPASLPRSVPLYLYRRRELQQYKFTDDEFELTVVCQLEEGLPLAQVCCKLVI